MDLLTLSFRIIIDFPMKTIISHTIPLLMVFRLLTF